jgi:hypothetical protein
LANLNYSFAFLCFAVLFLGKINFSRIIIATFVVAIELWAYSEFSIVAGWTFLSGSFLLIFYATRFLLLVFAEETTSLKNKMVPLMLAQYLLVYIAFNVGMI